MELAALQQEINAIIAALGDDTSIARPALEREVVAKIRQLLDATREQRTSAARADWESYLPYAARRCYQLTRLEEGWEEALDYFASEYAQYCLDLSEALLNRGDISGVKDVLARVLEAARMLRSDRIFQVDVLLQALETAFEISDKKRSLQLYAEAEKVYRKQLAGGSEYTGSAWLPRIKKMGQKLERFREKLQRYYQYAETVTVSLEADSEGDLQRLIDYLQTSLPGKVSVTRKVQEESAAEQAKGRGRFRARVKFTLEPADEDAPGTRA